MFWIWVDFMVESERVIDRERKRDQYWVIEEEWKRVRQTERDNDMYTCQEINLLEATL